MTPAITTATANSSTTTTPDSDLEINRMLQQSQITTQRPSPTPRAGDFATDGYAGEHLSATQCDLASENRALKTLNHDLETFVYAISHDLRAPLRTIRGFSQLLTSDLAQPLNDAAARDVAGIQAGIDRMQQMVSRWLKLAHRDHADIQRHPVDLSAIAHTQLNELQIADPRRSMATVVAPNMVAVADQVLVEGLLQNLLSNAWKFTQHNNGSALVEVGMQQQSGETVFFVRDNGIGFCPVDAEKLFQPFQRLSNATRFGGTGVGLVVAQRIVERHAGRIWAQAELNRGATFSFTLNPFDLHSEVRGDA